MRSFLTALLACSLSSTAIAALYKLAAPGLMKLFRPLWCYYAWVIIIIGLIVPFRPQFESAFIELPPIAETLQSSGQYNLPVPAAAAPGIGFREQAAFSVWAVFTAVWAFGAALHFAVYIVRHLRFMRAVRRWSSGEADAHILDLLHNTKKALGIRTDVGIAFCEYVDVPMLTGFMNPCILLPAREHTIYELDTVFKHELTHFKHRDLWIKLLSVLAISIHWFNPILRYFLKEISTVCEIACDDAVLKNADLNERKQYSLAILDSARKAKSQTSFSTAFSLGPHKLRRRIDVAMNTGKRTSGVLIFLTVIALTASSGIAFSVSGKSAEKDYIGEDYMKERIINGAIRGDYSTDHYITGALVNPEPEPNPDMYSDHVTGAKIIDLRYRYSFDISPKDAYERINNIKLLFDYDFTLSDYISYEDLNRQIGTYFAFIEATFKAASVDEFTQDDGLFLLLKVCKEYIEQNTDSRLVFRYYLSGTVGDTLRIIFPHERISRELDTLDWGIL